MSSTDLPSTLFSAGSRVLVLCPHTDDELGCAGTILRLIGYGLELKYVALSRCEASVPAPFPKDTLETECRACAEVLGIRAENVHIWRYPVRHFPEHRQDILERFVQLRREYGPSIVLLPCSSDAHQDHQTVSMEGFRAFKHCSVLGYELPQNLKSFQNTSFVRLSEDCITRKTMALSRYRSQAEKGYLSPEFIRGLARVRGVQCNSTYAEAFEVIRLVI